MSLIGSFFLFNVVSVQEFKEVVDLAFNRFETSFDIATANGAFWAVVRARSWAIKAIFAVWTGLVRWTFEGTWSAIFVWLEAVAALHWACSAWEERHFAGVATVATDGVVEFTWGWLPSTGAVPVSLRFSARGTKLLSWS